MSIWKIPFRVLGALAWLLVASVQVHSDTFTVTSPDDSSDSRTLRGAITAANQHAGPDQIVFDLPADTPITVNSSLNITDQVTLDGGGRQVVAAGQKGFALLIFNLGSNNSQVTGLSVVSSNYGIWIDSTGNRITRCRIGTDFQDRPNRGNDCGIYVAAPDNLIGGQPADGNVISGNRVGIQTYNAQSLQIQGNIVGLNSRGNTLLANATGIWLGDGTSQAMIGGNTLAGNNVGLLLSGLNCSRNQVVGNIIGMDAGANTGLANATGIVIGLASDNTIGAAKEQGGNIICGNSAYGILMTGGDGCCRNIIQNNRLGITSSGQRAGNGAGIYLPNGWSNLVGGNSRLIPLQRNLICGNNVGIFLGGEGNTLSGNFIGVNEQNVVTGNSTGIQLGGKGNFVRDNVISGNWMYGVYAKETQHSFIQGNYMGTDTAGLSLVKADSAPLTLENSSDCLVGGPTAQDRNIICGTGYGILLNKWQSTGNTLAGNWIGLLADGSPVRNGLETGIILQDEVRCNSIGYPQGGPGNLFYVHETGIISYHPTNYGNGFYSNTMCGFSGLPVWIMANGNNGKPSPVIAFADTMAGRVSGTSQPRDYIEVFSAWGGTLTANSQCLGWTMAQPNGLWGLSISTLQTGGQVRAAATDCNNNTSPYSGYRKITAVGPVFIPTASPSPTPSATVSATTATPTPDTPSGVRVYPVPGRTQVHFLVTAGRSGQIKVELYNLAGERVAELQAQAGSAGPVDLVWVCGQAAPGIYFSRVLVEGTELSKQRVAVVR
jgi:hypothetical protein